ncbi:unnamed protein product [Arabidopsis thaliana]|uniref:Uncharacterized protein n=4 Tax=Arabidopsis TaxID=3701 RepID=A0A654G209_ARATH|nr:uncharacterized protein AT5G17847 [Arabidopsis thaliana]KAG7602629.1 hypothetical protein ISN45_At05g016750 [Arabidopsis thaliana x Arabidopsis arenosa]KAG7609568.1 hypothetical protein ISN44_As05g016640 [Arabidopsis suecica]AED92477.1 hypothetical protein AT5G17847 [Arabidopsis thaliana]CAA0403304.1 unnamed protein product [Arabidopsis thaliana]VYS67165.1 unnamed protein product [Arabidopsis thaliana]|eukprot:NP_001119243.1 hypothetical protein AT5G17847 [Arabidopsis thaliana]
MYPFANPPSFVFLFFAYVMERENDAQFIVKPTHKPFPKPKSP